MDDLERVISSESARPPGIVVTGLREREYSYLAPGMSQPVRVTTDPDYYQEHTESLELWSPGNPLFPVPEVVAEEDELPAGCSVERILDGTCATAAGRS